MAKVVRCFNCSEFQMSCANQMFKCIKCLKSRKIDKMKIYFEDENLQLVTQVLQKIKFEKGKIENKKIDDDFLSADKV